MSNDRVVALAMCILANEKRDTINHRVPNMNAIPFPHLIDEMVDCAERTVCWNHKTWTFESVEEAWNFAHYWKML